VKAAVCVPLLAGSLLACSTDGGPVCPAVLWGSAVVVELADGWGRGQLGSLRVDCTPACEPLLVLEEGTGRTLSPASETAPLTRGVDPGGPRPESAVVTVLSADGRELARLETDLEFVRDGGSEECGGPMVATVAVPAP
jgi:hypothetical protein